MSSISFDCSGNDFPEEEWEGLMRKLEARFAEAGLPSLYSDRWDDREGGCVFEGAPEEIEQVRKILSEFPVTVGAD